MSFDLDFLCDMVLSSLSELDPLGDQWFVHVNEIFARRAVISEDTILGSNLICVLFNDICKINLILMAENFTWKKSLYLLGILNRLLRARVIFNLS